MEITYKKTNSITIDDIENINKFKDISNEEATELLKNINELSALIYQYHKQKSIKITEPQYLQAA